MKTLAFVFAMVLAPFLLIGQNEKSDELEMQLEGGLAIFQSVYEVGGDKETLFSNAKQWLFETYNSGKSVLQMSDKEQGVIIGDGMTNELYFGSKKAEAGNFKYGIKLEFKPGRYRITIDNIQYKYSRLALLGEGADYGANYPDNWPSWPRIDKEYNKRQWDSMKRQALREFNAIAADLYKYLAEKPEADEDW